MACLNGDGSLTVVAGAILAALATADDRLTWPPPLDSRFTASAGA